MASKGESGMADAHRNGFAPGEAMGHDTHLLAGHETDLRQAQYPVRIVFALPGRYIDDHGALLQRQLIQTHAHALRRSARFRGRERVRRARSCATCEGAGEREGS